MSCVDGMGKPLDRTKAAFAAQCSHFFKGGLEGHDDYRTVKQVYDSFGSICGPRPLAELAKMPLCRAYGDVFAAALAPQLDAVTVGSAEAICNSMFDFLQEMKQAQVDLQLFEGSLDHLDDKYEITMSSWDGALKATRVPSLLFDHCETEMKEIMLDAPGPRMISVVGMINSYEIEKRLYILVEGTAGQLRSEEPVSRYLALEQNKAVLLDEGRRLWAAAEPDVMFATASEDPDGERQTAKQQRNLLPQEEDSSSSEPEEDDKEPDAYPALDRRKAAESDDSASDLPPDKRSLSVKDIVELTRGSKSTVDPIQALVLHHLLAADNKGGRGRRKKKESRRTPSSSSASSSRSRGEKGLRGSARAMARYRRSSERMWKRPMKHVKRYMAEVEEELGVEDTAYNLWDYTRRIPFGKQKGLFRMHYLASHILKKLLNDDPAGAALMTVLTLRCLHQVGLDNGNWELGWMITTLKDPLSRKKWGGEAAELENAADYLKAVQELERRSRQLTWRPKEDPDDDGPEPEKGDKVWKPPKGPWQNSRENRRGPFEQHNGVRKEVPVTATRQPARNAVESLLEQAWHSSGALSKFLQFLAAFSREPGPGRKRTSKSSLQGLFRLPCQSRR
eukprot:s239_g5.t1